MTIKQYVEPAFLLVAGVLVAPLSPSLALYLMIAGGCVYTTVSFTENSQNSRVSMMHDLVLEQETIAERFREMRGDLF